MPETLSTAPSAPCVSDNIATGPSLDERDRQQAVLQYDYLAIDTLVNKLKQDGSPADKAVAEEAYKEFIKRHEGSWTPNEEVCFTSSVGGEARLCCIIDGSPCVDNWNKESK